MGLASSNDRLRVGEYLEEWLSNHIIPSGRADSTKADYVDLVRLHLVPALGNITLSRLTALDVERFMVRKRTEPGRTQRTSSGYSAASVKYMHAVLRTALRRAVRLGLVGRNVAELVSVEAPRRDVEKVHDLTDDEIQRLIRAATDPWMRALVLLVVGLGLRRGEALGLRWKDLDPQAGTVRISHQVQRVRAQGVVLLAVPKTRAANRTLFVPRICLEALRVHRSVQRAEQVRSRDWSDHGLIFPSSRGTPMDPRNLTRRFHRLCEEAGLPRERLHNLRHTAATVAYAQGLDDVEVSRMIGHERASYTRDVYTHLVPALQQEGADRLGEVLEGKPRHKRVPTADSGIA